MLQIALSLLVAASASVPAAWAPPAPPTPPETVKKTVTNEYHGATVTDDYQWLENWADPAVKAWSDAQNGYCRAVLDGLPGVEAIRARVTELVQAESVRYTKLANRNDRLFALKLQPPKQQAMLVWMPGPGKPEEAKVILDPNALDAKGTTAIDWFVPSPDGKMVAVSISKGGSESGDVSVFDTITAKQVGVTVPRVNGGTAGGDLAWAADSTGFFYTRYPRGEERPEADRDFYMQVYYHVLSEPTEKDRYELGKDFPRIAEVNLETSGDGFALASVQNGDGGEFAHYLRTADGKWTQITAFPDKVVHASIGPEGTLFLISRADAPRGKILSLPLGKTLKEATVLVPEDGSASIETSFSDHVGLVVTRRHLLVVDQIGGPNRVRAFDFQGKAQFAPAIPIVSSVEQVVPMGKDDLLLLVESYLQPPAWYQFKGASGDTVKTALATTAPADFSDCKVVRETAVSKDGTKVPMTIVCKADTKLDGTNPTILWGYGGYGVSISPSFRAVRRVWLERGGVYAYANIRGGGELGSDWHYQGNLTKKQNVFDDFAACADRMIELKYTSSPKLAILGGSNGGLLMGATFTQRPDLARAVVSDVGIYDMLRVELSPNGSFNVTEFGTVKNPDHFKALYAYSPYHHVKDATAYPAILMMTGANDPRVDPMHSRKMIARLQAASSSGRPILLRTSANSGHGMGSSLGERIEQDVDRFAFLFHELGVPVGPAKP